MAESRWNPKYEDPGADIFPLAGDAPPDRDAAGNLPTVADAPADVGNLLNAAGEHREDLLYEVFQMIHKINNHLQVVTINAEMMEMMAGGSNRYVEKILDAAILIRELMDDFRDHHSDARRRISRLRQQMGSDIGQG